MDYKYVIIGTNIVALSLGFIILSLMENLEIVLGISLSFLILGIVVLVIGLTYVEPLDKFYRSSYEVLSVIFNKVLEDTNLAYNSVMRTCLSNRKLLLISKPGIKCSDIYPGIGVIDGKPFIAVPLSVIMPEQIEHELLENIDEYELEVILRDYILHNYSVGKDVKVEYNKGRIVAMFYGLREDVIRILKKPANPFKALILATLSTCIGKEIIVEDEEIIENNYVLTVSLV